MRWLVMSTVLGACAPTPPLETSGLDPSQFDVSGVRSGPLTMQLGTTPQIQLPIALAAFPDDTTNLLDAQASGDTCSEGYVGVNLFPAVRATASTTVGMSTVTPLLQGPAVARFMVEYSVPYDCQGARTLSGKSTFTMLPSGRIERLDESVVATATPIASADGCACATTSSESFFFSSFWSFRKGQDLTSTDAMRNGEFGTGCTVTNGQTIAVKFDNAEQRGINGTHLAYFSISNPFTLTSPQRSRSSIAIVPGATCADALKVLDDPKILVDNREVGTEQGIYSAIEPHTSTVEVTTNFPVPNGFALEVNLAGATHARVLKEGLEVGYTAELDGEHPVFWFNTSLLANETITIEPLYTE